MTNTVCFNCFLCLSQLSAPNGVRVGRGGALGGFVSLHLLKHSQSGEGLHPIWHLRNLWLSPMCAHSTPEVIHPIQNHPFWLLEKRYRQVETVPLVLSLTQEVLIASQTVQNLFMVLTSIRQQGRM